MPTRRHFLLTALTAATLPIIGWLALRIVQQPPVAVPLQPFFVGLPTPLNIAHRGASGERAEHSWDAYDLALGQGADVLELDVRMTRDGVLVVAHDRDLTRVAGVPLPIASSSLEQLRHAAGDRAPIPLVEVLARYSARLNLEIKEDRPEVAGALLALLRKTGRQKSVIVASFHAGVLHAFREAAQGEVATAAHVREAVTFVFAYFLGLSVAPEYASLQISRRLGPFLDLGRPGLVAFAHAHGLAVYYWTIDDESEMRALLEAGADGVMTNYPERLGRVARERRVR